jgi:tight adherence protein B
MNNNVIVVLAVVGVLALLEGVYYFIQASGEKRKAELKRRLSSAVDDNATTATVGPQILRSRKLAHNPAVHNFLQSFDAAYRLENLLDQTELEWTVAQLLTGCAVMGSLALFYFAILKGLFLGGLIAGVLFGLLPIMYVRRARDKRTEAMSSQLPEALEMMSRSLRAGLAIQGAFQLVAKELHPPIATEFAKCYEEQKLGKSIDEAVRNMVARCPGNLDLKIFAVMIAIQRETGGNMIELLEGIAGTIRDRYNFYGKLRVITSEGRSAALILCSLPLVVCGALLLLNPDYLTVLVTDPMGKTILGMGISSMSLGIYIMNSMVKIEV